MKRSFLSQILTLLFLSLAGFSLQAQQSDTKKPNVLLFVMDDLRPELGCYGKDYIKSPNIDGIASRGIVFNHAYCQEAVCSPSRSSFLTGTRPDTTKVWDLKTHFRKALPDVVTLLQNFKNNGYFVQGMGKVFHGGFNDPGSWSIPWVNPKAPVYALPENVELNNHKPAGEPDGDGESKKSSPGEKEPYAAGEIAPNRLNTRGPAFEGADVPDNTFTDGKVCDLAIKALREIAGKKEPFVLAVGFVKPHLPFVAPKKYWDLYDPQTIALAPNPFRAKDSPEYAVLEGDELRMYHGIPTGHLPDDLARDLRHGYFAGVSYSDAQFGKVLAELKKLGLDKDTIVMLWGDNGWKLGEHDAWAKHSNVENDANIPLIVSIPGMKAAGSHSDALVELVDLYPTLSDLAGLPLPGHLEGTSFKPLLENPSLPWKQAAFSQYPRSHEATHGADLMGYSMRTDRYRFTVWVHEDDHSNIDSIELYDHKTDPQENTNIAKDPANKELVASLMEQWKKGWKGNMPPISSTSIKS